MRITINDVKTSLGITETYDIVNAITNSNPQSFSQYVPLATKDNVLEVGQGILINQTLQNAFVTDLVERIGKVVVTRISLQNPLKKFKKGFMPQGRTIEQIFTDITKGKKYDPENAETTLFQREIPNVKVLFHERNRQDFYEQTISDEQLQSAFVSWGAFENFVSSIINAIYNSAEVEEFEYMKLLVDNYYSKGMFTVIPVTDPTTSSTAATEFVKKVRATSRKMSLNNGSRDYNALAVRTKTDIQDMHLIIDADLEAEIDVDVLAKAFNMDKASFLGNVTVIDNFASSGLEAVLIDKDWYMVYDNLIKLENVRNAKGLYWNYFYHVWQTMSVSRFANAVAFVSGTVAPITQVIIDPTILALKQGKSFEFTAYVRATDGQTHNVSWSVEGSTSSSSVMGSTAIDSNGLLTLDATQTGELLVKAISTYLDTTTQTTLSASATSGATTITVADSSVFSVGDNVIVGTETTADSIASIDSATSITLTNGLASAQSSGANVTKQVSVTGESIVTVIPV